MTRERLLQLLNQLSLSKTPEEDHLTADQLLLEYINDNEISEAFDNIRKWYS